MLFDIQINVKIEADNELEAEELLSGIMDETVALENKLVGWEYIEYVSDDYGDEDITADYSDEDIAF